MPQKAADLGGYGEEGAESGCREDQDHDLWYRTGPILRTAFNAVAASTGFTRNASEKGPQLQVL